MKYPPKYIVFLVLCCCFIGSSQAVRALPLAWSKAIAVAGTDQIKRIGYDYEYGCGIDYACPPQPYYGKRYYGYRRNYGSNGVYIHNNYGTVNVYVNRHRRPYYRKRHYDRDCDSYRCTDWRDDYWRGRRSGLRDSYPDTAIASAAPAVQCGGYPCDQNCGPSCWYGRLKTGYCGHGCDVYRQKVLFKTEDKTFKIPKVVYETRPRPAEIDEAVAYPERRPEIEERVERRRYEGPEYPVR